MNEEQFRAGLREVGLSQYEADAYLAVLERGTAPAVKIAERADVPKTRIYDVLRDLEDDGYVETFEQDSLSVRARDPGDVLETLQQRANTLATTADEIEERWERPELTDHKITIVKRYDSVLEQFEVAAEAAENRIQVAVSPDRLASLRSVLAGAIDREVFVKLCVTTGLENGHAVDDVDFEPIATEARHRTLPAPFTALIDRSQTFFASVSTPSDQYGIIVDDVTLTYVFNWYFQSALWETWTPVYTRESTELEYVDIRQCIRDLAPLVNDGVAVPVTVHGFDAQTGDDVTLTGEVVEIMSAGSPDGDGSLTLPQLAGQATLVLRADGREYGVGGWGASLEDVEATRIVVEDPDPFDDG